MSLMDCQGSAENSLDSANSQENHFNSFDSVEAISSDSQKTIQGNRKRKISRELFSDEPLKLAKLTVDDDVCKASKACIVSSSFSASQILPTLSISQINNSNLRFAFEGKVLNVYGTYKSSLDFKKFLKADLADREGFATITLVVSEGFIPKFLDKIEVNACLRLEGVNVIKKNAHDGGTVAYSLHVDATSLIIKAEPFEVSLIFVPEIRIVVFLSKATLEPSLKATLAFVVIQIDKVSKSGGSAAYEQLTIADGPTPMDLATLSFVHSRRDVYHSIVSQFQQGEVVIIARNIGVFKDKFNTLSILDITLLTPVFGERRRAELESVFRVQISEMGYGKEVYGTLQITNFNNAIIVKKCLLCKGTKVNKLALGEYCFECSKFVEIVEVPTLEGIILVPSGPSIDVTLIGDSVDKVFQLEEPLATLYNKDVLGTRVLLSEISKVGTFLLDKQGSVIGFNPIYPTS